MSACRMAHHEPCRTTALGCGPYFPEWDAPDSEPARARSRCAGSPADDAHGNRRVGRGAVTELPPAIVSPALNRSVAHHSACVILPGAQARRAAQTDYCDWTCRKWTRNPGTELPRTVASPALDRATGKQRAGIGHSSWTMNPRLLFRVCRLAARRQHIMCSPATAGSTRRRPRNRC
jgi:hypothetical protein